MNFAILSQTEINTVMHAVNEKTKSNVETKSNVGELLVELAGILTTYAVTATAIVLLSLTWVA